MTPLIRLLLGGLLAAWMAGCGTLRVVAVGGLMDDLSAAAMEHDDAELVGQAMPAYLLLLDGLIRDRPGDAKLLRSGAEAYTSYATLVEVDDPERARSLYRRARDYGRRALVARRPAAGVLLEAPFERFQRIDTELHDDDLPYVFWSASPWGAWIGASAGSMEALADLPRVIHLMQWVLARDETFRHASPHLFLGVYHASLPRMLGGDPERARQHFERALDITEGKDLMVRVYMARTYARQVFDRELFVRLLREVLAAPVDADGDLILQNTIAQRAARALLEDVDAYF